jgi:hypothetical protein
VRDGGAEPLPGSLLWTASFAPANLSIIATGRVSSTSGAAEHLYEASLASPLTLNANRDYILAISARSINTRGDAWQWQDSEFFGGHGANYSYASARWSAFQDTDSAFELIGRQIPSPAAISLAALASAWRTSRRARGA